MLRDKSLRVYLAALLAACVLPMLILAIALVLNQSKTEREKAELGLQERAAIIRSDLETNIQTAITALETLRNASVLESDDLVAFAKLAARVKADHPSWIGIVLTDPGGQQLFNLAAQPGQKLPNIGHYDVIQGVIKTLAPAVSEVMIGKVRPVPLVGIDVPVIRNGELKYILGLSIFADHFTGVLKRGALPEGWHAEILDYKGQLLTGLPLGQQQERQVVVTLPKDVIKGVTTAQLSKEDGLAAFDRSSLYGYTAVVSVPDKILNAPLYRSALILVTGAVLVVACGILAIVWIANRIVNPLKQLAESGTVLLDQEAQLLPKAHVEEIDSLASALLESGKRLRASVQDRERTQEALRQAQKMEAVGLLTGGIAHDFNNLLAVFSNGLQILELTRNPEQQREARSAMRRATDRGTRLTRQLLVFAQRHALQPEVTDVAESTRGILELLGSSLGRSIELTMRIPDGLWAVKVDVAQLELALLNLSINAKDAMPDGGSLEIVASNISEHSELGSEAVRISIRDSGHGIPDQLLHRVFEPFFTTKKVGKGTGLGLSQVYGFVKQSGGTAWIESIVGSGTTVFIELPRTLEKPATKELSGGSVGPQRILLVDDDQELAPLAASMLQEAGHFVAVASDAKTALNMFLDSQKFDVVISDVIMPGEMDGLALARHLKSKWNIPVVLTTAFALSGLEAEQEGLELVRKPYSIEALNSAMRVVLTKSGSRSQRVEQEAERQDSTL